MRRAFFLQVWPLRRRRGEGRHFGGYGVNSKPPPEVLTVPRRNIRHREAAFCRRGDPETGVMWIASACGLAMTQGGKP